jgi:hypothetical protein
VAAALRPVLAGLGLAAEAVAGYQVDDAKADISCL